ncbi:thermonuclease family protein [Methylotuvimicrobium sp.]|uniref:thermonuclease family protein n=1 Tax=Methylotuvimicrobium sp. TaxID=2822413 RepID=UPI003D65D101
MLQVLLKSIVLLLGISAACADEIYRWQDENGKLYFSDKRREGAERLTINPGYSYHRIQYVYDGDTVKLADGRKIRLLGINAPEVEGRNKNAEAGGEEAKRWLTHALKGKRVRLVLDTEQKDKYGRALAHLFTEDGLHLNLELVRLGLAALSVFPPNLRYSDELLLAQTEAEKNFRGIWRRPEYRIKPASSIRLGNHRGWQRISGRVKKIRTTRKYVYLTLGERVDFRIERANLALFPNLQGYVGKEVEIRGWLNRSKERFSMLIRHPSSVKIL